MANLCVERQSAGGAVASVVSGALAITESAAANRGQKARAWCLLTMAYVRQRDNVKAGHALDMAKAAGLEELGGWYAQAIPQLEKWIDEIRSGGITDR